ncbi:MAG TPA: tetratricopeptide repeat protein, partial [Phyllobacterium sp.]|nr:tetratricopeptide repeat protein [Phyllobacterium sp.]
MTTLASSLVPLVQKIRSSTWPPPSGEFEQGLAAYERGRFIDALRAWRRAAEMGDAEACYRIGRLYAKNEGVAGSAPDVAAWYERAAQLGHVEAQFQLGLIFYYGVDALV